MGILFQSVVILVPFLCSGNADRETNTTLTVTNGGQWGVWSAAQFCPEDTFAVGYDMKVESVQFTGDDTSLNAIRLICSDAEGGHYNEGPVTSGMGGWGNWVGHVTCNQRPGSVIYLESFALQVELPQGGGDDTAANWVKFNCRAGRSPEVASSTAAPRLEVLNKDPGAGNFGTFGAWSETCPDGSAICGLSTKVEGSQGNGDDTALNDVIMYCCQIPEGSAGLFGK